MIIVEVLAQDKEMMGSFLKMNPDTVCLESQKFQEEPPVIQICIDLKTMPLPQVTGLILMYIQFGLHIVIRKDGREIPGFKKENILEKLKKLKAEEASAPAGAPAKEGPPSITDYLALTRFQKSSLPAPNRDFYNSIYSGYTAEEASRPELFLCKSTDRFLEFLSAKEHDYLIYDGYLREALDRFNRLYYDLSDKEDAIHYSYKCFAEIYHFMGQDKMAMLCAMQYMSGRGKLDSDSGINLKKSTAATETQEKFILLHELCHWSLNRLDKRELQDRIYEKRYEILHSEIGNIPMDSPVISDAVQYYLSNILRTVGTGVSLSDGDIQKMIVSLRPKAYENVSKLQESFLNLARTNDSLVVECICDEYAYKKILEAEPGLSHEAVAMDCLIGLESLQTLTAMKNEARNLSVTSMDLELTGFRKRVFRLCTVWHYAETQPDTDMQELRFSMASTNEHFSQNIRNPIFYRVPSALKKFSDMEDEKAGVGSVDINKLISSL